MRLILIDDYGNLVGQIPDAEKLMTTHNTNGGQLWLGLTPKLRTAICIMFKAAFERDVPFEGAGKRPDEPNIENVKQKENVLPFKNKSEQGES